MPENLLNLYLLKETISFKEIVHWLCSTGEVETNVDCDRQDFVIYYINYIREVVFKQNKNNDIILDRNSIVNRNNRTEKDSINVVKPDGSPRRQKSVIQSPRHNRSLCLGDFLIRSEDKQKKRRIKPTVIKNDKENVEVFNGISVPCENIEESRDQILKDLVEVQKLNFNTSVNVIDNKPLNFQNQRTELKREHCSNLEKINLVSQLYVWFIKNGFIPNVFSDLYLLISVLVNHEQQKSRDDKTDNELNLVNLFSLLPNQIYFATQTLIHLTEYLSIFDKTTINFLLNNATLKHFLEEKDYINFRTLVVDHLTITVDNESVTSTIYTSTNINFVTETDNRDNFSNDLSFNAFRKQRDLFYEYLDMWEEKHISNPDWDFATAFSHKIRNLFRLSEDPINMRHFANLFKAQLLLIFDKELNRCHQDNDFLQHFHNIDTSKLNKLKQRLSTKKSEGRQLDRPPDFPGYQLFFKNFISHCGNSNFLEHLKNSFTSEILTEINYPITSYDSNERVLKNYKTKSAKMLVLAKFLGYVESLPWQRNWVGLSERVVRNQVSARFSYRGILDLESILFKSKLKCQIVFTVCWVVVYLSMLDYVTLRLPWFEKPIFILFCLYRQTRKILSENVCPTKLLLTVSLNYLFGLSHFPTKYYYRQLFEKTNLYITDNCFKDIKETYLNNILKGQIPNDFPTDKLNLVTETVFNTSCPALESFQTIFIGGHEFNARHITPLTKIETPEKTKEEIQKRLEEAFLNSQSPDVKKIIEFATEKITSGCVRHLSANLLQIKKDILFKYLMQTDINQTEFIQIAHQMKTACSEKAEAAIVQKSQLAVEGLMSVDELSVTVKKCADIVAKLCREKISIWIDSVITSQMIEKTWIQEKKKTTSKKSKYNCNLPPGGKDVSHSDEVLSAVTIMQKLMEVTTGIISNNNQITVDEIEVILNSSQMTIDSRCDVNDNIGAAIHKLTLELAIVIVVYNPDLSETTLKPFLNYWLRFGTKDIFANIVSIRNVHMISTASKNVEKSWKSYTDLLTIINENDLVSSESFERQCLGIFQQNWNDDTLRNVCNCYRALVGNLRHKNVFSQMLDFVSGYCVDLDGY